MATLSLGQIAILTAAATAPRAAAITYYHCWYSYNAITISLTVATTVILQLLGINAITITIVCDL